MDQNSTIQDDDFIKQIQVVALKEVDNNKDDLFADR
jgi:hypothetical protein